MATKRIPLVPEDQIPDLRRSSDIVWGQWKMHAGKRADRLQHILIHASTNTTTQRAIRRACQELGEDRPAVWPGYRIELDTEIGKALLGTPNGRAVPYLLSQHRATLGHKAVFGLDMFFLDSSLIAKEVCFLFHVLPASPGGQR